MITVADAHAARTRIAPHIRTTPVFADNSTWFKCEFVQHTGSFKARGAFNRLLAATETAPLASGVVTASGGNAGLAIAYAAKTLGVPAAVYVPETAPPVKVAKLHALGAEVHQIGTEYAVAYDAATKSAAETGALFCHAYDQPEICAGQATLGLELRDQLPTADTVLVSVGGGGLMAGLAVGLDHTARVVAVEPAACPTLHTALSAGAPTNVAVAGVAADSLGAPRIGDIAFDVATTHDVASLLVDDDAIAAARKTLWTDYRVAVEHGAACAYAALTSGAYRPAPGERVVVILCGANTDPSDLAT